MQEGFIENIQAWALAIFLFPGLFFAVLLALLTEWIFPVAGQIWVRGSRAQSKLRPLFYPLYNFLKLAGKRHSAAPALLTPSSAQVALPSGSTVDSILSAAGAVAPLLALIMLPLPASPLMATGQAADIVLIVLLLLVQPLSGAFLGLRSGGLISLHGVQDLGRLLTGLLPALIAIAALIEVSGTSSLRLAALTLAPETGAQTLVRLISGAVLLFALPWWRSSGDRAANQAQAGQYAGRLLQSIALAAFWALLVLPMPGDQVWAVALYVLSTFIVAVAMRLISERLLPVRRERDRANLVWATALPVAVVSLLVSFWWGGL